MDLEITSQSHNRVDWVVRTKILWIELGLIIFVSITVILLASTASSLRWRVVTILISVGVLVAGVLAATMPLRELGFLERLPDGGELVLNKTWIPIGRRRALMVPVDDIAGFRYDESDFQDSEEDRYHMARLWVIRKSESQLKLTGWLEPEIVKELGDALAKACRVEYDHATLEISESV